MYKITLANNTVQWYNEKIIMKIILNEDGTFELHHFNDSKVIIKAFSIFK